MTESENNKYYQEVIEYMRVRIKKEGSGASARADYLYDHNNRVYRFDLVELDEKDEIKRIYEIVSNEEYLYKLNALYKQLKLYHKVTKADVFSVSWFVHEDRLKISVISLTEIEQKIKDDTSHIYTANSFQEFYKIIHFLFPKWQAHFFRGQPNNSFEPIPGIYRESNIKFEDIIYHEAIRRKPSEFTEEMTTFDNLVKMQHYELPTRLLDTTTNPLVALYFACQKAKNEEGLEADGEVLVYPRWRKQIYYYDSELVCLLANIAKQPIDFDFAYDRYALFCDIKKDKPYFREIDLKAEFTNKVLCVLPKLNNERIINQHGAFFIFGIGENKKEPASIPVQPFIVNIKANAKERILGELQLLGIDEAFLFPETDKAMKQIKREFLNI